MLSDLVEAGKVGKGALAVVACSDVSLCASRPLQEVCYQYWPSCGIVNIGEYRIDLLREEKMKGFVLRTLSVLHSKVHILALTVN